MIAELEITYDLGTGKRESTGTVPLEMTYTSAGHGYVNAEVMKHIDEVQIFELNKNCKRRSPRTTRKTCRRWRPRSRRRAESMGPRAAKKTMLAKQVLQELNVGGRVSKKTQLAVDDSARMADEMPSS